MIIELENPAAVGTGDPEGMIVVAQKGVITTRKVVGGKVEPYREVAPEGDFEEALANHPNFLVAAGFKVTS